MLTSEANLIMHLSLCLEFTWNPYVLATMPFQFALSCSTVTHTHVCMYTYAHAYMHTYRGTCTWSTSAHTLLPLFQKEQ